MEQRTAERVEDWPTRRFDGGYDGLHDLAAEGFSGAVGAPGGGWLMMTGGRVVGVPEGGIERFEDGGGGPAHAAPEPALPLLFAMRESDGETRGEYYTENTPLSEVDATLRDGGFTGYVELSENVLSGDYYLVYHAGERDAVAYIGNAGRLKTGEEAFDRAADEVGIYSVTAVDVTVTEIPGEGPSAGAAGGAGAAGTAGAVGNGADDGTDASGAAGAGEDSPAAGTADESPPTGEPATAPEPSSGEPVADGATTAPGSDPDPEPDPAAGADSTVGEPPSDADRGPVDTVSAGETGQAAGTAEPDGADTADEASHGPTPATFDQAGLTPAIHPVDGTEEATSEADPDTAEVAAEGATATAVSRLRDRISELQRERDGLQDRLESATTERDQLRERLESTAAERDRLQERAAELESTVDRLQGRIEELEARLESAADEGPSLEPMDPTQALVGTNLFVRYDSKSEATLADAHEGGLNRETVGRNLGLEHHTDFDAARVSVEGEPYEAFLNGSTEYRFVRWLLTELLYEIRDTENVQAMRELYDALPEIDRAELHGSVEAGGAEQEFDVVFRDRVGDPLAVANLSASREATTASDLEALLDGAGAVAGGAGSLVGAFLVTASYFEPDALETAEAAADSGGLLSRSKRASYVKRGGSGFHLCLVEGRDRRFHVVLPDL
jgi:prefoldin subunit 5